MTNQDLRIQEALGQLEDRIAEEEKHDPNCGTGVIVNFFALQTIIKSYRKMDKKIEKMQKVIDNALSCLSIIPDGFCLPADEANDVLESTLRAKGE